MAGTAVAKKMREKINVITIMRNAHPLFGHARQWKNVEVGRTSSPLFFFPESLSVVNPTEGNCWHEIIVDRKMGKILVRMDNSSFLNHKVNIL